VAQFVVWKISQSALINKNKQMNHLVQPGVGWNESRLHTVNYEKALFRRFLQSLHLLQTVVEFLVHHFNSAKFFRHNYKNLLNKTYSAERHFLDITCFLSNS